MSEIDYFRPRDLDEAVAFLRDGLGRVRILAGGTDLMIDMRAGSLETNCLCDISRLPALKQITIRDERLEIGAGVTISDLLASKMITRCAPALKKAAAQFAGNQIRNVATIGGNVAHCSPCGDTLPPLIIHDAEAVVRNADGERSLAIADMAGGPYQCTLAPDEIITRFRLTPMHSSINFADFQKIGRRRALSISRISMAAMARREKDGSLSRFRFALGACTPTPHRFEAVESFLTGRIPTEKDLWAAGKDLARGMLTITGRRPSAVYKEPAIAGLFVRMMHALI